MEYKELTKEFLLEHYINQRKNINQIARELKLDGRGIWRYLKKFDIPRRKSGGTKHNDYKDKKFGKLFVEEELYSDTGFLICRCVCDCGNKIDVRPAQLNAKKKSCGCSWEKAQSERAWHGYEEISGEYWGSLKTSAIKRNLEFSITKDYAWDLFIKQNRKCSITGLELIFSRNRKMNKESQTASIDRTDNTKGYVENNIQWVHKSINRMKNDMTQERFLELCRLVAENNKV